MTQLLSIVVHEPGCSWAFDRTLTCSCGVKPEAPVSPPAVESPSGGYDPQLRRRSQRAGRMSGCYIYISGEELKRAGFQPGGELPLYRVWGRGRGSILVRLYRRREGIDG